MRRFVPLSIAIAGGLHAAAPAAYAAEPGGPLTSQEVAYREQIRDVLLEYGRAFDERRLEDYANLFAENGQWIGGPTVATGPAEVLEMITRVVENIPTGPGKRNFHVMTNMVVDVEGDTATAWSRFIFYMPGEGGKAEVSTSGTYDDQLVRVGGTWKFLRRQLTGDVARPPEPAANSQ
jgi:3-phenylpropionate/cinnamic acid dioxygenase small subunit